MKLAKNTFPNQMSARDCDLRKADSWSQQRKLFINDSPRKIFDDMEERLLIRFLRLFGDECEWMQNAAS